MIDHPMTKFFISVLISFMLICVLAFCTSCVDAPHIYKEKVHYYETGIKHYRAPEIEYSPVTKCIDHELILIDNVDGQSDAHLYVVGGC